MKMNSRFFITLISYVFYNVVAACAFPPEMQHPHEMVVDEADSIVLAKAVSYEPRTYMEREIVGFIYFQTIEILKGTAANNFHIKAWHNEMPKSVWASFLKYTFRYNYLHHNDNYFWEGKTGRVTSNNSMCILVPDFSIGSIYLLIEGKKQDSKNYELITFESDKWLKYVRNRLKLNDEE